MKTAFLEGIFAGYEVMEAHPLPDATQGHAGDLPGDGVMGAGEKFAMIGMLAAALILLHALGII